MKPMPFKNINDTYYTLESSKNGIKTNDNKVYPIVICLIESI
ncbi:hypothetical protein CMALT394_760002 [Carnobacterium maltaromaticum]|nr:hypothetical protein CMALT394_760002 [Carnobacterium maltaromaticum]